MQIYEHLTRNDKKKVEVLKERMKEVHKYHPKEVHDMNLHFLDSSDTFKDPRELQEEQDLQVGRRQDRVERDLQEARGQEVEGPAGVARYLVHWELSLPDLEAG